MTDTVLTDFYVEVVRVGPVSPHPNADRLELTEALGYPVVIRKGEFQEGDLAVYVATDAIVPDTAEWAFLKGHRRIRALKLRGIYSQGLLVAPPPGEWHVGDDMREVLGITKYEAPLDPAVFRGEAESDPGFLPVHGIASLRKYKRIFLPGEEVVLTEKIHGTNARFAWHKDRFWAASHRVYKVEADDSMWWRAARRYDLVNKLATVPGIALYGEIYGQVQDLRYGATKPEDLYFAAFDAYDIQQKTWLSVAELEKLCTQLGIPRAPELWRGPWSGLSEGLLVFAEGKTTVLNEDTGKSADHVREGFVIRPVEPREDGHIGRIILKCKGQGYELRK